MTPESRNIEATRTQDKVRSLNLVKQLYDQTKESPVQRQANNIGAHHRLYRYEYRAVRTVPYSLVDSSNQTVSSALRAIPFAHDGRHHFAFP